jgi:hypothetical protein
MITVKSILINRLKEIGADGLCNPGEECGCGMDDLAPCFDCMHISECVAAKYIHPKEGDPDYMEEWPDGYYRAIDEAKP